ncbi:MAG: glycerol-3-phosphate dehydrogenase, partial [Gammaproteobacteria bacterium HGW-Gammaproteobacteria-7]
MSAQALRVAVLGAGSWGTALASLLAANGHATTLWGRDQDLIAAIDSRHENPRYLPGIALAPDLRASIDLAAVVASAELVLVVVPSHAFAGTLEQLAPTLSPDAGLAWACKGFEPGTGRFLHEVAREHLGDGTPLALVTGPSFAQEVARGLPTAVTVAGWDMRTAVRV